MGEKLDLLIRMREDDGNNTDFLMVEAVDEIVRLRKQVAKAQSYREASKESYAQIVTHLAGMKHANKRQREMTNKAWREQAGIVMLLEEIKRLRHALQFYDDGMTDNGRTAHFALHTEVPALGRRSVEGGGDAD